MYNLFPLLLCCLFASGVRAQQPGMYFVGFVDKPTTSYSTERPEEFLGPRALERRAKHGTAIEEMDLPLAPDYVAAVRSTGAQLWLRSKWMNGMVVATNTEEQYNAIADQPFVDTIYYVAPKQYDRPTPLPYAPRLDRPAPRVDPVPVNQTFYGYGYPLLELMAGDSLHRMGYRGRGVVVAVFDGGFPNVNYKDFLGYYDEAAVPANYDLVEQDTTALDGGSHGATVLSTMAAHHPFFFIGMAPEARYLLFKTENGRGEHRLEEINYAVALELADSAGVDIINSSLGYTTFNDSTMNYTYDNLDGKTSPASVAVDRAFARGMIVVTSAGNSGGDDWRYIGTPADADKAFSIGALDAQGERAYFSSFGPTPDGRVKPDVSAPGVNIPAVAANGQGLTGANGTSLSAPLITGLTACLLQAVPEATNVQVLEAIRATAAQADNPNEEVGHGLPDYAAAYRYLSEMVR